jgi:hypothetical protein
MQKVVIFGVLTALFFLFTPATRAQNAADVERLRKENELLKKEVELLKKEIEQLKKEAKAKPDGGGDAKTGEKPRTKAFVDGVEYELIKCVRRPKERTRVTFTFAARTENKSIQTIHICRGLNLSTRGGEELNGRLVAGPKDNVMLTKGEWSKFQVTYEGVDPEVTEFDEVGLVMGGRNALAIARLPIKFYRIKIEPK